MPNSLQIPLERQRDLQRRWGRLLQRTATSIRARENAHITGGGSGLRPGPDLAALLVDTMPPRDPNDDDDDIEDDEEEEAEDREPAVIREPDGDE
jgi:hypothetical protein